MQEKSIAEFVDMEVELLDSMGSDLTVVNAARVSFDKESNWDMVDGSARLKPEDVHLIEFLAKHNHWTPFAHCFLTLRVTVPIFVVRQLAKHQVGLVINEVSRRYVDKNPMFFMPIHLRPRAQHLKQGSGEGEIDNSELHYGAMMAHCQRSLDLYGGLIEAGLAPELARIILPLNTMTQYYWSGSLTAFARVCSLRMAPKVQLETRHVAGMICSILEDKFPVSASNIVKC